MDLYHNCSLHGEGQKYARAENTLDVDLDVLFTQQIRHPASVCCLIYIQDNMTSRWPYKPDSTDCINCC